MTTFIEATLVIDDDNVKITSPPTLIIEDINTTSLPEQKLPITIIVKPTEVTSVKTTKTLNDLPRVEGVTTIIELARKYPPQGYEEMFLDADAELEQISDLVAEDGRPCTPALSDTFNALHMTPVPLVVFIGQDPYPTVYTDMTCDAMGCSFSVRPGFKVPSSLSNIYKELALEYPGYKIPNHGDLTPWMQQGCLFLNMCLTFPLGDVDQHGMTRKKHAEYKLWDPFIKKVCADIAKKRPDCIYVLWGAKARKVKEFIGEKAKVLESVHPSGLSAAKGFFGCGHFLSINNYLKSKGEAAIDWQLPGPYKM
jgi:uracil-DNA glycosylase